MTWREELRDFVRTSGPIEVGTAMLLLLLAGPILIPIALVMWFPGWLIKRIVR